MKVLPNTTVTNIVVKKTNIVNTSSFNDTLVSLKSKSFSQQYRKNSYISGESKIPIKVIRKENSLGKRELKSKSVCLNERPSILPATYKTNFNLKMFDLVRTLKYDLPDKVSVIKKTIEVIKKNPEKHIVFLINKSHYYLGLYFYDSKLLQFKKINSTQIKTPPIFDFMNIKECFSYCSIKQKFILLPDKKTFNKDIAAVVIS